MGSPGASSANRAVRRSRSAAPAVTVSGMSAVERELSGLWVPSLSEVRAVAEGRSRAEAARVDLLWREAMPPGVEAHIF